MVILIIKRIQEILEVIYRNRLVTRIIRCFHQAYLARLQCSPSGLVAWKMDFTSTDLVIDGVSIAARFTTAETGRVDWKLVGDDESTQSLAFSNGMYLYA